MVDQGVSQKLDVIVEFFAEGLGKIDKAADKIKDFGEKVNQSTEQVDDSVSGATESMDEFTNATDESTDSMMRATGQGLALLFAGRFLSSTFGGLSQSMWDVLGVSDMLESTIITVLMPAFSAVSPILFDIMEFFMDLPESVQKVIGGFVLLAAAIAPVITIVGQLMAGMAAFGIGVGGLVTAIGVGALALSAFWAAFIAGQVIVDAVTAFISGFVKNVKLFVSALRNLIRGDFSAMWDDFRDIIDNSIETALDILSAFDRGLFGIITDIIGWVFDKAKDIGSRFVDGIVDAIKAGGSAVLNALDGMIPGISVTDLIDGAGDAIGGAIDRVRGVNDFVLSDDKLLQTHPNDVIFGMKNPEELGRGAGEGGDTVINIDNPQVRDDRDIDKIVAEVEKRIDRGTGGRSTIR